MLFLRKKQIKLHSLLLLNIFGVIYFGVLELSTAKSWSHMWWCYSVCQIAKIHLLLQTAHQRLFGLFTARLRLLKTDWDRFCFGEKGTKKKFLKNLGSIEEAGSLSSFPDTFKLCLIYNIGKLRLKCSNFSLVQIWRICFKFIFC